MRGVAVTGTSEAIIAEVKDIMAKAFGEDGARVRRNVEMMRKALRAEHKKEAKEALLSFIESKTA